VLQQPNQQQPALTDEAHLVTKRHHGWRLTRAFLVHEHVNASLACNGDARAVIAHL
jgi:hypothetical protein